VAAYCTSTPRSRDRDGLHGGLAWGMLPLLLGALLQGLASPGPASAPAAARAVPAEVQAVAEAARDELLPSSPGLSFAVRRGDEVWAFAWGYAHVEDATPVTTRTRFRIASISKPLTALAAALLWQQGGLDLDADVRGLVPEFTEKPWSVSARQLGGHLGGVRHYNGTPLPTEAPGDVVDAVAVFAEDPLVTEPGTKYVYSTFGFNLLGAVVQRAAGRDFRAFVADAVCAPLGMVDTVPEDAKQPFGEVAALYEKLPAGIVAEVPRDDLGYKWPGGGYLSTASDLVRMTRAVCDERLLTAEALALMRTSQRDTAGKATGYSFGWSVDLDSEQRLRLAHGGAQRGARAFLLVYPDLDFAVAVLANSGDSQAGSGRAVRRAANALLQVWTRDADTTE